MAETMNADQVRNRVSELVRRVDASYLEMAELLWRIYTEGWWSNWGFGSFPKYCENDLTFGYRKAAYMVRIWRTKIKYDLQPEDISALGWRKMAVLCSHMTEENKDELIELAKKSSYSDLELFLSGYQMKRNTVRRIAYSAERSLDRPLDIRMLEVLRKLPEFRSIDLTSQKEVVDELTTYLSIRNSENLEASGF